MPQHPEWLQARLIDVSRPDLALLPGSCQPCSDGRYLFCSDAPANIAPGTRLLLKIDGQTAIYGELIACSNGHYTLKEHRTARPDQRRFPRIECKLFFKYKPLGDPLAEWTKADEDVELSIAGLRFTDRTSCCPNRLIDCEIGLTEEGPHWRCRAHVVRYLPLDDAHLPEEIPHLTVIEFDDLPQEATDMLVTYMLQMQCAAIENLVPF